MKTISILNKNDSCVTLFSLESEHLGSQTENKSNEPEITTKDTTSVLPGFSMSSDNEMVNLIKGAAQEGQFCKMSTDEIKSIYHYGTALVKNVPYDEDLIKAIDKFETEIKNRLSIKHDSNVTSKETNTVEDIKSLFAEDIESLFTVFSGLINFFYTLIKQYPIALLFVLIITAYGAWCVMEYFSLYTAGIIRPLFYAYRGMNLYFVSLAGIFLGWSGLRSLVNACQDWDQSLGYLKIIGGTALIAITHFFLYVMRTV